MILAINYLQHQVEQQYVVNVYRASSGDDIIRLAKQLTTTVLEHYKCRISPSRVLSCFGDKKLKAIIIFV